MRSLRSGVTKKQPPAQESVSRLDGRSLLLLRAAASLLLLLSAAEALPAQESSAPAPAAGYLQYKFTPGTSVTYKIAYSMNGQADMRVLFQGQQAPSSPSNLAYTLNSSIEGELISSTLRAAAGKEQIFQSFRGVNLRIVVNGQEQTAQEEEVRRSLEQGYLIEVTPQGLPEALYLEGSASRIAQDFIRTLLSLIQVVGPDAPPGAEGTWTVREEDRNGPYEARYRLMKEAAGRPDWLSLRKTKIRYFSPKPGNSEPVLPGRTETKQVLKPEMRFAAQFDTANGELAALQGTETIQTEIQGKKVAQTQTLLSLLRSSHKLLTPDELAALQETARAIREKSPALALYKPRSKAEIEANIQRTELGQATKEDLLALLEAQHTENLTGDKREAALLPLYLKFKALIYVHPEDCPDLARKLAQAPISSDTFQVLTAALGAVAHRQAQAALLLAIHERLGEEKAAQELIAELGGALHPTKEAEKELRRIGESAENQNISGTALLALGSMARNLSQKSGKRAEGIVEFLAAVAEEQGPPERTQHALQALGNAASRSSFQLLKKFAASDSPSLRAAALDGVRSVQLPEVDELLFKALATDPETVVRQEAAFALGFRKPGRQSLEAQTKALAGETNDNVRAQILDNLAKMAASFPEVRATIEAAAANDPSERVRKTATGLLQTLPQSPHQ